jgi:hypothetical protein
MDAARRAQAHHLAGPNVTAGETALRAATTVSMRRHGGRFGHGVVCAATFRPHNRQITPTFAVDSAFRAKRSFPAICHEPVCGCDLKNYVSRCAAHAAGVPVLYQGHCGRVDCAARGGRTVDMRARDFVFGGPLPCADGEVAHSSIREPEGIADTQMVCCVDE